MRAHATTMDFSTVTSAGETCIEAAAAACYGDSVNATSDGFGAYGQGNGFTPNVTASYAAGMQVWTGASNPELGPDINVQTFFTLAAAPGFKVQLNSVDIGTFGPQSTSFDIYEGGVGGTLLTSFNVTAASTTTHLLSLMAQDLTIVWTNWNVGIARLNFDQVAVAATPIPAALPLFIAGLAGLGFALWRRSKWTGEAA
jgi:hypothetical protein